MNKDVIHVMLHDHAIKIMTMRTIMNNPFLNMSYLLNMTLVLVKNFHMIVINTNVSSQVITSQATMVMDSIEGDVDVHSHVVTIVTTMMT